jgi:Tfp pilus assembly protein PilF
VDREESNKRLKYLINNTAKLPLIVGAHGVGKTYFIKNFMEKNSNLNCIYISFEAEIDEHNGIEKLLRALEKSKSISFFKFFNINYAGIFRMAGGHVVNKTCDDLSMLCNILKNTISVKDKDGIEKSIAEILIGYIFDGYERTQNTIILDNFHLCDKYSLNILVPFFKKSLEKYNNLRFVVSLTLGEDNYVKNVLEESVPREEIEILEFNDFMYFYEILFDILDISDKDKVLISKIYEYCSGNPQQLLSFMHKLDAEKALKYSEKHKRAEIIHEKAMSLLHNDSIYIPFSSLSVQQRFILCVVIEFGVLLPLNLLIDIVKYVMFDALFNAQYKEAEFLPELLDLNDKGIIKIVPQNNVQIIKMEHDLKLNYYKEEIKRNPFFAMVNHSFYKYVTNNKNNFSESKFDFLVAIHSYKGEITNWQTYNYEYGKKLFDEKDFANAAIIFLRLKNCLDMFSVRELLVFIEAFYNSGKYHDANDIIDMLPEDDLEEDMYSYLYLKAKIYKFCLKQIEAEKTVNQLLQLNDLSKEQLLNALSMEERVFLNSSNERQRAFIAYEKIKQDFKDDADVKDLYGSCLKTAIEFYRGESAEEDLAKAYDIAKDNEDQYELGAIYTNKGFDLFWQGQIDDAIFHFQKAYDALINIAEYEISYPLNNIANCYIVEGDYDSAMHYLKAALYWNQSSYVNITLKILLAYCLAVTDKNFDIDKNSNSSYILNNIDSPAFSDISIKIKANYLIGCIYDITGNPINAKVYKGKAYKYAREHNQKYLPYIWMQGYSEEIALDMQKRLPSDKFCSFYKKPFDPWLVTLSHD